MATREHALYRLLERPHTDAAKGGCYVTGSQGPCVDTGVLIDYEGTLTISLGALVEMCEVAGFSFNAEARKLEAQVAQQQYDLALYQYEVDNLQSQLDAVALAVARAAAPPPVPNKLGLQAKAAPKPKAPKVPAK